MAASTLNYFQTYSLALFIAWTKSLVALTSARDNQTLSTARKLTRTLPKEALFGYQNEGHASGCPLGMLKSQYTAPGHCCDTIGDNWIPHGGGDNRCPYAMPAR